MGANLERWNEDMALVNRSSAQGANYQMMLVLGNIAHSLAVIADHLTEEGERVTPSGPSRTETP
jgi:hypothetical protein